MYGSNTNLVITPLHQRNNMLLSQFNCTQLEGDGAFPKFPAGVPELNQTTCTGGNGKFAIANKFINNNSSDDDDNRTDDEEERSLHPHLQARDKPNPIDYSSINVASTFKIHNLIHSIASIEHEQDHSPIIKGNHTLAINPSDLRVSLEQLQTAEHGGQHRSRTKLSGKQQLALGSSKRPSRNLHINLNIDVAG